MLHTVEYFQTLMKSVLWLVALGGIALDVYIIYDSTKEEGIMGSSWDLIEKITYETLKRSAWAVCLAWIIYACNTGCAGKIGQSVALSGVYYYPTNNKQ